MCKPTHKLYRGDIMCPNQLITTITALAAAMAEGKSVDEIELLAAIFSQLGDTLDTIAAQKSICSGQDTN